jgi:hypothetical protein
MASFLSPHPSSTKAKVNKMATATALAGVDQESQEHAVEGIMGIALDEHLLQQSCMRLC